MKKNILNTMKFRVITVCFALITCSMIITACGPSSEVAKDTTGNDLITGVEVYERLDMIRDNETGCYYFKGVNYGVSPTPRLGKDGLPMCGFDKE